MSNYTDKDINDLVYKAIVPKGLRPETPEEIDAMLEALGGEEQSEQDVQRMLRKIRGQEPLSDPTSGQDCENSGNDAVEMTEAELALYRNRNDDIPPEVEELLQDMEDEALEDGEDDGDESNDDA